MNGHLLFAVDRCEEFDLALSQEAPDIGFHRRPPTTVPFPLQVGQVSSRLFRLIFPDP
jgi:hypothetical protein